MVSADYSNLLRRLIGVFNNRQFAEYAAAFHEDAVIEYPQSGERIEGRSNALAMFRAFVEPPTFDVWRVDSSGDMAVLHAIAYYPGSEPIYAVLEYQFDGALVVRETAYFGAPFTPADWRRPFVRVLPFQVDPTTAS